MSYEKILELMNTLPDKEHGDFKTNLKGLVQELNQERGKAAADILKLKPQLDDLQQQVNEGKKQTGTYKEIAAALTKAGVEAKDMDATLKKLNITKTLEDENVILKDELKNLGQKVKGFETEKQVNERKEKVTPLFEKALGEFVAAKQKEGKQNYKLAEKFVDKEKLYKELDIENETIRNAHFSEVLQAADVGQQKFMEDTGMGFTKSVHKQGVPEGHYQNRGGINETASESIKNAREAKGSVDSVAQGLAELHAAEEKEK